MNVLTYYLLVIRSIARPSIIELIGYYLLWFFLIHAFVLSTVFFKASCCDCTTNKRWHSISYKIIKYLITVGFGVGFPIYQLVAYYLHDNSFMVTLISSILGANVLVAPLTTLAFYLMTVHFPKLTYH